MNDETPPGPGFRDFHDAVDILQNAAKVPKGHASYGAARQAISDALEYIKTTQDENQQADTAMSPGAALGMGFARQALGDPQLESESKVPRGQQMAAINEQETTYDKARQDQPMATLGGHAIPLALDVVSGVGALKDPALLRMASKVVPDAIGGRWLRNTAALRELTPAAKIAGLQKTIDEAGTAAAQRKVAERRASGEPPEWAKNLASRKRSPEGQAFIDRTQNGTQVIQTAQQVAPTGQPRAPSGGQVRGSSTSASPSAFADLSQAESAQLKQDIGGSLREPINPSTGKAVTEPEVQSAIDAEKRVNAQTAARKQPPSTTKSGFAANRERLAQRIANYSDEEFQQAVEQAANRKDAMGDTMRQLLAQEAKRRTG